jgi:cyclohexanone monooxygenase
MYSYSFGPELQQEWSRSERFAAQPEIRAYLDHVADRYDLRRDIQLNTRVVSAHYDQTRKRWRVSTVAVTGDPTGGFHGRATERAAGFIALS